MKPFTAILPDPDPFLRAKGNRLSVRGDEEAKYLDICEERVWPDKVDDLEANAILEVTDRLVLPEASVRWLHEQLAKVIAQWDGGGPAAGDCDAFVDDWAKKLGGYAVGDRRWPTAHVFVRAIVEAYERRGPEAPAKRGTVGL